MIGVSSTGGARIAAVAKIRAQTANARAASKTGHVRVVGSGSRSSIDASAMAAAKDLSEVGRLGRAMGEVSMKVGCLGLHGRDVSLVLRDCSDSASGLKTDATPGDRAGAGATGVIFYGLAAEEGHTTSLADQEAAWARDQALQTSR